MSAAPDIDGFIVPRHSALLDAGRDADAGDRSKVVAVVLELLEQDRNLAYAQRMPSVALSASVAIGRLLGAFEPTALVGSGPVLVTISATDAVVF